MATSLDSSGAGIRYLLPSNAKKPGGDRRAAARPQPNHQPHNKTGQVRPAMADRPDQRSHCQESIIHQPSTTNHPAQCPTMLPKLRFRWRRERRRAEAPLRAELFNAEQLASHALKLAEQQILGGRPARRGLLSRLDANEQKLRGFNRSSVAVESGPERITPAEEWLLDNFYLIEEQVQIARRHLPQGYSRGLPRLAEGASAGLPRVYNLVLELILHVDAQIDAEPLTHFVAAYQTVCPLTLGELWAIPIMLRLGLIENLQRIKARLAQARNDAHLAEFWVKQLRAQAEENPSGLVIVIAAMEKSDLPVSSSFVAEFCQNLSRQSPVLHLARTWLTEHLGTRGLSIEHLSHQESQNQAADQVSVSHSITSLRFLSAMNWKQFVEGQSLVEAALQRDPAAVYSLMDFDTRDRYRNAVESVARRSKLSEQAVANCAVELAAASAERAGGGDRAAHVGYYLVDHGLPALRRATGARTIWHQVTERGIRRLPLTCYIGGILAVTLLATAGLAWNIRSMGATGASLAAFTLLLMVSTSRLAAGLVNRLTTFIIKPKALPRMDFAAGIAAESRTMVVIPSMLKSVAEIEQLIATLEIHYLANQDPHLHFALLPDFADAPAAVMDDDDELLEQARAGIQRLNQIHAPGRDDRFYLFHRPRLWNAGEGVWMGFERKRGKLADFNALLRSSAGSRFSDTVGDLTILPSIRYVIPLDTDTRLPREAAWKMVGAMAHPLNRPVFDTVRGTVTAGYGVLQPRLGVSLNGARRSWFARLFSGEVGVDPYTRQVSDVYQDLFGEGSFIGKGIYDVDAFRQATDGRFPNNTVLSHDLLEGCLMRSGLLSDVELYEAYPSRYNVDIARRHRWIRGDWQIIAWLMPRVTTAAGHRTRNPLSALSRWKIFDNLRRSLEPVALVLLLVAGWFIFPPASLIVMLAVVVIFALPAVVSGGTLFLCKPSDLPWAIHVRNVGGGVGRQLAHITLALIFLPYEAFVSLDAITRTLTRLFITRKRRLQWQSYGECQGGVRASLGAFYRAMWLAPALAGALAAGFIASQAAAQSPVYALLAVWACSPLVAWLISRPRVDKTPKFSGEQTTFLRHTARRHWHYFETFVTAEHNGLPPDNMQEQPTQRVAARTSPTNIGLSLLANLAARDFGYLSVSGLLERTELTLTTMQRMDRHRNHFYNWYDTRTLQPLVPLYVSSVDSGNLAGHLLTLGAGLRELASATIYDHQIMAGLHDTASIVASMVGDSPSLTALIHDLANPPPGMRAACALLERVIAEARLLGTDPAAQHEPAANWVKTWQHNGIAHLADLEHLAPWLTLPNVDDSALPILDEAPTLRALAQIVGAYLPQAQAANGSATAAVLNAIRIAEEHAVSRLLQLEALASQCDAFANMDFGFLFDPARKLFITGFNVGECRGDPGYYDLLASEARLCSYIAIALGQVPQDHWFLMGRLLLASRGQPVLVSWSGSMFEYLMPQLVMPTFRNTLLDHTLEAAVRKQIAYGRARGVPWGISESAYNRTDQHLNYQYRAFGVPGLGLKRGLVDDLVIAPYASVLALMVKPIEACCNLQRLARQGCEGNYGFYEAVDYTPSRLPPDTTSVMIRSFMVHHQGMSLLALDSVLHAHPMQRRFMACPPLKATEQLLQERVPRTALGILSDHLKPEEARAHHATGAGVIRVFTNPEPPIPEIHLLSNGRYHVAISSAGAGYSRWRDLALTRWREDATCDCRGLFIYLQDEQNTACWSAAYQPTKNQTDDYSATFSQSRAEFWVRRDNIEIQTRICVSPEDDVELRRLTLTNHSPFERVLFVTSYVEVVLAPQAQDEAHPAFSNLFVQTWFVPESSAVHATRRARSADEQPPWLLHMMVDTATNPGEISCETDRGRFIGRGANLASPDAMQTVLPLSNSVGSLLDPVLALRRRVTLPANGKAIVYVILGATETRAAIQTATTKYQDPRMAERAFDLAWVHSQVVLHQLGACEADVQLYCRMAGALVYANPALRAHAAVLASNQRGNSGLWSYGLSGDLPLVLVCVGDKSGMELVGQVIRAHAYWRLKGLQVELVIVCDNASVYHEVLHDQITDLIASGTEAHLADRPGGIFVRRLEQIPGDDYALIQSVARIVLDDKLGTLVEQLLPRPPIQRPVPPLVKDRSHKAEPPIRPGAGPTPTRDLVFHNGLGGFTRDGREYVITLQAGQTTPMPWVNIIANPHFGTLISERGAAYTWVDNARELRLTPWHNDPVIDPPGEALYIRDEETGRYWSPTPAPTRSATPYVIRHGFGYTVFEHSEDGIASELWVYVAMDAPVKYSVLKCRNESGRPRRISVTGYCEWVLGDHRGNSLLHIRTELDPVTGALFAQNPYNAEFGGRIAFIDVHDTSGTLTGNRTEFIGRNGNLAQPAAMGRARLSGRVGAGLDPCGAVQVVFDLEPRQETETRFRLGIGRNRAEVHALIRRFRTTGAARSALESVWQYWRHTLGTLNVETPDSSVNIMTNGWLLYQTVSCRMWGRTGFYQSGGAYGFRDQLQDSMALIHAQPALVREHLLRAAGRQFPQGDVQHWWHPPAGRGVRTQFSDDYLWLPYVTCHYVTAVGDTGVLDHVVPYLEARALRPGEESVYTLPTQSAESATLYQHCKRAIENGLKVGPHGLPLIGCGDWNDGMNRVGTQGRGESVWLAFFLYDVLHRFATLADDHNDQPFAERCRQHATGLQHNIEKHGWDGDWYRRAYFDDGRPIGSASSPECQIDSLPQSWAVLSGAGNTQRAELAMESVARRLVRPKDRVVLLFDPPFDSSNLEPGYIKGYSPGIRENGGQYTHAAIWVAMAFAKMGKSERAWEIFALINPVNSTASTDGMLRYRTEPYVVAADVGGAAPHIGRGGWSWYTGSAAWMYRLLTETLLGIRREGDRLRLTPCPPSRWGSFTIDYRYYETVYHITFSRVAGTPPDAQLLVDGIPMVDASFPLVNDRETHTVAYALNYVPAPVDQPTTLRADTR
jgi:cyclic beta-1,2-glucan synthetase